ncbi:GNAT family N-acetyltransferase [Kushneria aurantia]|uniref:GNAT family N-acetyltransferase n=1 Tax=Kushneria aurantia TaxID=504092 RepID=A0ABV6FZ80_9GAMM|nr:GNAT family N-acetyltransferase [Kushneria aurantia]
MHLKVRDIDAVCDIETAQWNALTGTDYPFLRHEFLDALERSGAVSPHSGWTPRHLTLWQGQRLVGVMPRYFKDHSWGEYVFDWQWADAWERAGGQYYPKQLSAIPFTPASGPRLALAEDIDAGAALTALAEHIEAAGLLSWHLLFPDADQAARWRKAWPALLERQSMQYHWFDRGYGDFDGFLATMTSKRRKETRRERRLVAEQGLTMRRLTGRDIDETALHHFYRCYQITYLEHGQRGYLDFEFFRLLWQRMPQALVLIQALDGTARPVAAALCLQGSTTLYGRYWGSEVVASCLHFETCYYQGIEHCLATGLNHFDPGTQGEHKIARGFEPIVTRSLHWLAHDGFRQAVEAFLGHERGAVDELRHRVSDMLPFRRGD